jgi:hypothetical protein
MFTVTTPLGDHVSLSRDRWRQIIRFKHPALKEREQQIRECLEKPTLIRESAKERDVHLHYARTDNSFLCVVTAPADGGDRFVVTAYYTRNIKHGTELWKK